MHKTVKTLPHPTLVVDRLCRDAAAAPVCVEVAPDDVFEPEPEPEPEPLPTKALSLESSTNDALTELLVQSDGRESALPSTKFTATHCHVHTDQLSRSVELST